MGFDARVHHRQSIRLRSWDYRETGPYFVTICTYERALLFEDPGLQILVREVWRDVVWRDGRSVDEFVVMPNHVHGIVWLSDDAMVGAQQPYDLAAGQRPQNLRPVLRSDRTVAAPLRRIGDRRVDSGSLGAVVRAFKSASAKRINGLRGARGAPLWQRNYHDRVIRSERELDHVRQYILDNPRKWNEDKNNPANFLRQRS